ncbi:MAG: DUF2939 domain-containing protein [Pseudolabrys sp.]
MRRTIAIGAILLFLWLAYSVWPFFAVYRLASAVQVRDVAAVKELVDFRALRGSLTAQIVRTYLRMTGKIGRSGSMLEQFAVGLGASVADPIVAKLMSPEALLDLLQNGRPSGVFSDNVPSIQGLSSDALGNVWRAYTNSELGIARFFITVPVDKQPEESFRLGFCLTDWTWKLCSADLPEQLQLRLAQEISKSEQR